MSRGGIRKGAGRPAGIAKTDSKPYQVNVRLTEAQKLKAEKIGDGKASAGLRRALEDWRSL